MNREIRPIYDGETLRKPMKFRLFYVALAAVAVLAPGGRGAAQQEFPFQIFERYLEPLVRQIGMPGLAAAIVQGGEVVWHKEYGYADVERKIPTRFDTPFPIGGMTQAMTGVLAGVCIDRFFFNVNNDIRLLVPTFPVPGTSTRQVLSHSTDGRFSYDPNRYSQLTGVIESAECFKQPFRQAMAAEVLNPLTMTRSVPGLDLDRPEGDAARGLFDAAAVAKYRAVLADLAVPYRLDLKGRSFKSEYPSYGLDAASGMVSTVEDLARFEGKLDKRDNHPLSVSTLDQMWSNQIFRINNIDIAMPTGLGWFVTNESNQRLVWTFGHIPNAASALIVKIAPNTNVGGVTTSKRLTLIMLANSGGLAEGYNLENANVTSSPFVKIFLRLFI